MSLPLFSKLNKKWCDLYTDKRQSYYNLDNRVVVKQNTKADVTLKSTVTKAAGKADVCGALNVTYKPCCGEFEGDFKTCGALKVKGKFTKLVADTVLGAELVGGKSACSAKLFAEHTNKNFTADANITVNRDLSACGALSVVAGAKGAAVGFSVCGAFANKAFSLCDYKLAGRYVVPADKDLTIAFGANKKFSNFYTNFVYNACHDLELGAGVGITRTTVAAPAEATEAKTEADAEADAKNTVTNTAYTVQLAAAYNFDENTAIRTRWSSCGTADLAVQHTLAHPKVQFNFTSSFKKAAKAACTEGAEGEEACATTSGCPIPCCGLVPAGYGIGVTFGSFDA